MTSQRLLADSQDRQYTLHLFFKLLIGSLLVVGAIACAFYVTARDAELKLIEAAESLRTHSQVESIRAESGHLALDLLMAADHVRGEHSEGESKTAHIEEEFLSLLRNIEKYSQVRLVSSAGWEMIRVEQSPNGPIIVPSEELQNQSDRPYFLEAIHMQRGEIYLSHLDLKREHGEIQRPLSPVLRIATPVILDKTSGEVAVVVINCSATNLLKLEDGDSPDSLARFLLVNSDGYWIEGLDEADEWGFLFETRSEKTFDNRFPGDWSRISKSTKGQYSINNGLFTFETITPELIIGGGRHSVIVKHTELYTEDDIGNALEWKIVSYIAPEALAVRIAGATGKILVFAAELLVALWTGCWFYAVALSSRKRTLKELERSEAFNRSIVSAAPDAIIMIDGSGVIQSFNRAAKKIFGYQPKEVIGQSVAALMPEMFGRGHDELFSESCKSGREINGRVIGATREAQGRRADGTPFDIEISVNSFEVMGERMFTGVVRDITEQKRAAAEIELLALFPKNNPAPVVRIDREGKILQKNPAAESLFGIESDDSRTLSEIIPELGRSTIESCLEKGSSISRSVEVLGRSYLVLLKGLPEQDVCQLYAMDVTERNEAVVVAAEFGRLLDDSANEVYIADVETLKFMMVNKKACANLGYTFDEMMELSLSGINLPRPGTDELKVIVKRLSEGRQNVIQYTAHHIRNDGSIYSAEFTAQICTFKSRPALVTFAVGVLESCEAEPGLRRHAASSKLLSKN